MLLNFRSGVGVGECVPRGQTWPADFPDWYNAGMSTDLEPVFLAAIQADPDNEMHRKVYADWLEEQGDARCELLRLSARIRQFPKGIVHHRAGFDPADFVACFRKYESTFGGLPSQRYRWADDAVLPWVIHAPEYPDWWMWRDWGEPADFRECRRQVEALTNPPQQEASRQAWGMGLQLNNQDIQALWRLGDPVTPVVPEPVGSSDLFDAVTRSMQPLRPVEWDWEAPAPPSL